MSDDVLAKVASNPLWYHTLDLAPGVTTPGWFDLRPVIERLPWPDVRGKRCLDVGTYDGHLAFELERRGASEVIATDISDHTLWDWPMDVRAEGPDTLAKIAGPSKGVGFAIAKEILSSSVERVEINVYDLSPEHLGTFDVVVCGSLMLHLRDPLRALAAIRSVCTERFLSAETIDLPMTLTHPRRALSRIYGLGGMVHWTIPNAAGHRQMVRAGGFEIVRGTRPYTIPCGVAHPKGTDGLVDSLMERAFAGGVGVPHAAVLARPV